MSSESTYQVKYYWTKINQFSKVDWQKMAEIPGLFISVRTSAVVGIIQVLNVRGREDRELFHRSMCEWSSFSCSHSAVNHSHKEKSFFSQLFLARKLWTCYLISKLIFAFHFKEMAWLHFAEFFRADSTWVKINSAGSNVGVTSVGVWCHTIDLDYGSHSRAW